jgi:hypothetical protein
VFEKSGLSSPIVYNTKPLKISNLNKIDKRTIVAKCGWVLPSGENMRGIKQ